MLFRPFLDPHPHPGHAKSLFNHSPPPYDSMTSFMNGPLLTLFPWWSPDYTTIDSTQLTGLFRVYASPHLVHMLGYQMASPLIVQYLYLLTFPSSYQLLDGGYNFFHWPICVAKSRLTINFKKIYFQVEDQTSTTKRN